jgi:hypothetical protein
MSSWPPAMGDNWFPLLYPTVVSTMDQNDVVAATLGTGNAVMAATIGMSAAGKKRISTRGVGAGIHQSSRAYADNDDGMSVISKTTTHWLSSLVTFSPATTAGDSSSSRVVRILIYWSSLLVPTTKEVP